MVGNFIKKLWSIASQQIQESLQEVKMQTYLLEHHADLEVAHLHELLGIQMDEINGLKAEIERLTGTSRTL